MKRYDLKLFADYQQFSLQDEEAQGDLEQSWTEEATARLLAVGDGIIGVGTVRPSDVPVALLVLEGPPELDKQSDLIVEASLDVPSGVIVIAGCTDYFPDAQRVSIESGRYRVRVTYRGLSQISADGLDGDDSYEVALRPDPEMRPVAIVVDNRGSPSTAG